MRFAIAGSAERFKPAALPNGWMDHTTYQAQRYMPVLDGLRGIAVVLVIPLHLHEPMWYFLSGYAGVTIFFVLSGYLITRLALQEEAKTGQLNAPAFYIRRVFRILPLYYVVLTGYTLLILGLRFWPTKIAAFRSALPYYLSFFQEIPYWKAAATHELPFFHSWSLGVEEKFYILWPLLMICTARARKSVRLASVLAGAVLFVIQGIASENQPTYHLEDYGFILFGVFLALFLSHQDCYRAFARVAKLVLPFAGVIALITLFDLRPTVNLRGMSTLYALSVTILLGALVSSRSVAAQILSEPSLVLTGKISYGIYLVHILCIDAVERVVKPNGGVAAGLLAYLAAFLTSAAVAYVAHFSLERPMIRLGRRLSDGFSLALAGTVR